MSTALTKNPMLSKPEMRPQTVPWGALPDELRLPILREYFKFPNGLHSDRWLTIRELRVKPLLSIEEMAYLVPEALYHNNAVVIKPTELPQSEFDKLVMIYPPPCVNHWVRTLEFRPFLSDSYTCWRGGSRRVTYHQVQVHWLKKLASGVFGFQNIEMLRIVLDVSSSARRRMDPEDIVTLASEFSLAFERSGTMRFRTVKLEVVVQGHVCSKNHPCGYSGDNKRCKVGTQILNKIVIHQDPLSAEEGEENGKAEPLDPKAWNWVAEHSGDT